jgi:hypothetical protein
VVQALELHCHEVTVRFLKKAVVPPYEGSMIRGAFGRAFKQSCCPFPHDNGSGCPLGDKCPYGYVFETSSPEGARDFARNQDVPRPYIFEPPESTKMEYSPGRRCDSDSLWWAGRRTTCRTSSSRSRRCRKGVDV